ncbi:type II secretion system F family protein [Herbivorax sp. ANBcel31]|uniref:type II secretion system F family protein n=1 Tax=Herbivorax sp. ANBcel31 TaxID=3069754 RepID=UPI0027AEFC31|nr:type II secretion system F family protein [Herbivorax sp. ANBcel31]MDQ2085708.1 type II secretion system F family protein [Herbivorax sp. ANBcel31]
MLIIFIIVLIIFIVLLLLSKNKYSEYTEPLDKDEYKLKDLLSIGLIILDKFKYSYNTEYDRKILNKISELKGPKYSVYYLQIYWANKIALFFIVLLLFSLVGVSMEEITFEYVFFGLFLLGLIVFASYRELDGKVKKRRLSIQIDFPDFLNQLILLVSAGMTVSRAWEKIVDQSDKETVLYEELRVVLGDIRAGKSEINAFEDFAKRCRIPEITRFSSVIIQNLSKGSSDMIPVLLRQSSECWEMRKHAARRVGEEASSKLLFPMMLMFVAVILIVATPAVISLMGGM